MKLDAIARTMKEQARAYPGNTITNPPLANGATIRLRALVWAGTIEWRLQISREGKLALAGTPSFRAWERELATFGSPKYFNIPKDSQAQMIEGKNSKGKPSYAANFVWKELDMSEAAFVMTETKKETEQDASDTQTPLFGPSPIPLDERTREAITQREQIKSEVASAFAIPSQLITEHRIPQTLDEMRACAERMGQGVKIRGVNVFTGEM